MTDNGSGARAPHHRSTFDAQRSRRNMAKYERETEKRKQSAVTFERDEHGAEVIVAKVQSTTDPNKTYTLHAKGDTVTCNCRGYNSFRHCKHARALVEAMKEVLNDN